MAPWMVPSSFGCLSPLPASSPDASAPPALSGAQALTEVTSAAAAAMLPPTRKNPRRSTVVLSVFIELTLRSRYIYRLMADVGRVMLRHIQSEGQPAMTTTPRSSADFAGTRKSAWSATDAIKELILIEGLRPGDPMPTETSLCERLGIS